MTLKSLREIDISFAVKVNRIFRECWIVFSPKGVLARKCMNKKKSVTLLKKKETRGLYETRLKYWANG